MSLKDLLVCVGNDPACSERLDVAIRIAAEHEAHLTGLSVPPWPSIPSYAGPYIAKADWAGTRARQGESAAIIGFPRGAALALDQTRTVRTSMAGGIFSKVTPDRIQFDGFTIGGSSGSPIFNANGEVVAVHAAGLKEAAGLGFAVPLTMVIPFLPAEAKAELGIS